MLVRVSSLKFLGFSETQPGAQDFWDASRVFVGLDNLHF